MASGVSGRGPDLERGPGTLPALCLLPHVGIWFCSAGAKLGGGRAGGFGGGGGSGKELGKQGPFVCSRVCLFPLPRIVGWASSRPLEALSVIGKRPRVPESEGKLRQEEQNTCSER